MRTRIWHAAYIRWYDHKTAGHPRRTAAWGRISDGLCRILWPLHP